MIGVNVLLLLLLFRQCASLTVSILVPVTSRTISPLTPIEDTFLFTNLIDSLQSAILDSEFDKFRITLYLAIDANDPIYDQNGAAKKLKVLVKAMLPKLRLKIVRLVGFSERIGHIWNELVQRAYNGGSEYFLFASDDAIMKSPGFITSITSLLDNNLHFGVVSLKEEHKYAAAGSWPTFPCFHRLHLEIFGEERAFDPIFYNSFVDIWISDVYKPFQAAIIDMNSVVVNAIGGEDVPRYNPVFPGWDVYVNSVIEGRKKVWNYLSSLQIDDKNELIPSIIQSFTPMDNKDTYKYEGSEGLYTYGEEGYHYKDYKRYLDSKDVPTLIEGEEAEEEEEKEASKEL